MSLYCPQCRTELDQDFGVVNCSKCAAVLVIDIDGNVLVNSQDSANPSQENSDFNKPIFELPQTPIQEDISAMAKDALNQYETWQVPANEIKDQSSAQQFIEQYSQAEVPATSQPAEPIPPVSFGEPEVRRAPEVAEFLIESSEQVAKKSPPLVSNLATEISHFANKGVDSGPITYTVSIKGIDNLDVRDKIREVISHPGFGWNSFEVMSLINNGVLQLDDLNPAQASILVSRLRVLPVRVAWRQSVFAI